jgi:hypothetical protein
VNWWRATQLTIVGTLAVAGIYFWVSSPSQDEPSAEPVAAARPLPCDSVRARSILDKASPGIVRDIAVDQRGVRLMVAPSVWSQVGYSERTMLVAAADCTLAGPTAHLRKLVVEAPTGAEMASYSAFDLAKMREASGLAK